MRFLAGWSVAAFAAFASCAPSAPLSRRDCADKAIFAHYMIGEVWDEHTRKDIQDAMDLGLDAFALNINSLDSWATDTVERLFKNADELGFKLFFSFDFGPDNFGDPSQVIDYLKPFLSRPSYYAWNKKQLVSTFGGENFDDDTISKFKSNVGGNILFIPGLYNGPASPDLFSKFPSYDGVFGWNSWPNQNAGNVETTATTTDDAVWAQAVANAPGKLRIAGLSPLNFKHFSGQNWYRRGEQNLELRMAELLKSDNQPDMIEIQTWNDAPESHYIGNIWDEPNTDSEAKAWFEGFDHRGYQQVIKSFANAWHKCDAPEAMVPTNGQAVQGAFWHHPLTVGGDCSADPRGKPDPLPAEDSVSGVVLVAKGSPELVAVVNNGDKELGKMTLKEGYNSFKFDGLGAGKVQLEVWDGSNMVGGGYGNQTVQTSAAVCNYNFQVVGFPG